MNEITPQQNNMIPPTPQEQPPVKILSWKKKGLLVGLITATIFLFFWHSGDSYYANSETAKQVFWYGIVPIVVFVIL